jgi:hypothetical protein
MVYNTWMINDKTIDLITRKYEALTNDFTERSRRLWAATEAESLGRGGREAVHKATGLSRGTIQAGLKELRGSPISNPTQRVRKEGGGRKSIHDTNPQLKSDLESLIEPTTRGDPESPLRWTCLSVRQLASFLTDKGYKVGRQKVADILSELGYSLQSNKKTKEGDSHPDRDKQFRYISKKVKSYHKTGDPVISVDTKKKELVGEYKNNGKEWRPKKSPREVKGHDFPDKVLGKVSPYGVYDIGANEGWVNVGTDHDTAEFAVESIRRWWQKMGKAKYSESKKLLITADAGGSNSYRNRLWKVELQELSSEIGLEISVSHFPPGTSKWNKIEHRMFNHISMNWRGRPLVSHEVIVSLIAATTTKCGLTIKSEIDTGSYAKGIKITDEQLAKIKLKKARFHGEWNYSVSPIG